MTRARDHPVGGPAGDPAVPRLRGAGAGRCRRGSQRELRVTGVPLAREVHVDAEPPLTAVVEPGLVTVTFSPTGQSYAGSLTVSSPTGSVVVPVTATVASRRQGADIADGVGGSTSGDRSTIGHPGVGVRGGQRGGRGQRPRLRLRVIAGLGAIAGGLLVLASIVVPWRYGQTYADSAPGSCPPWRSSGSWP